MYNDDSNKNNLKDETNESNHKTKRLKGGKNTSKSSKMYQTNKSSKFRTTKDFNKKNHASVYMKEMKRYDELNKKRNQTARLPINKLKIAEVTYSNIFPCFDFPVHQSSKIKIEETHQKMINELNNRKNPYSAYWTNQLLEKRYNMCFGVNGFLNGVPVITILKKKNSLPCPLKKLREVKEEDEKGVEERNEEVDLQFNKNQKNFFKARKDIVEGMTDYFNHNHYRSNRK